MKFIEGKVALVTAGTSGIGLAAKRFVAEGAYGTHYALPSQGKISKKDDPFRFSLAG